MEDDVVERTADTRLEFAVEVGKFQGAWRWIPKGIERAIERHCSRGERSRFVAAEHIQTAEVLNGGKMLDDDLLTRHGDSAFRKGHRGNHGQEFRRQTNGQRDREEQRLKDITVACDADDHQEENEKENRARQEMTEISQALIEGGLFRTCREASRNIAKGVARIRSGGDGPARGFLFGGKRFAC